MPVVEPLDRARHDRATFACGEPNLDEYIRTQAAQHARDGNSATHVLVEPVEGSGKLPIIGFYSLAMAELELDQLQPADQARLPRYPVPAARIGKLAVHIEHQGKGFGDLLIGDAVTRCLQLREAGIGVRALIVDALHEHVVPFYEAYGFRRTMDAALTLYLPLPE